MQVSRDLTQERVRIGITGWHLPEPGGDRLQLCGHVDSGLRAQAGELVGRDVKGMPGGLLARLQVQARLPVGAVPVDDERGDAQPEDGQHGARCGADGELRILDESEL